jgi:hypothetical protein
VRLLACPSHIQNTGILRLQLDTFQREPIELSRLENKCSVISSIQISNCSVDFKTDHSIYQLNTENMRAKSQKKLLDVFRRVSQKIVITIPECNKI